VSVEFWPEDAVAMSVAVVLACSGSACSSLGGLWFFGSSHPARHSSGYCREITLESDDAPEEGAGS
jgi:hypothetical protein